jgi:hypothetical protein
LGLYYIITSPAADEIAKIEHELDILRSRYAIFERTAKIAKWCFIVVTVAILLAFVCYGIHDPLAAAIVGTIFVVIGGGVYLTRHSTPHHRWIDVASPPPGWPWGRVFNIGPKSEAEAIEIMIAERERRLIEIKARQA